MKKVKIMLMAICLVAVTGGLFAFKTMLNPSEYCSTDAIQTVAGGTYTCVDAGIPLICDDLAVDFIAATTTSTETNGNVFCTTVAIPTIIGGLPTFTCDGRNCVDEEFQTTEELP